MLPWFAVTVRSNHERAVTSNLSDKGYETFLPLYRSRRVWSDRQKDIEVPLFPGYTFCRFDPLHRLPILKVPCVHEIVGSRVTGPIPIPDAEIAAVHALLASGLPVGPHPHLSAGNFVTIESGPLAGVEGIIVEVKSRFRLIVSVTLLQRSVAAEIDRAWVVPRKMPEIQSSRPHPCPTHSKKAE